MTDPAPIVTSTVVGDITHIAIDDGKANALDFELLDQLSAAVAAASDASTAIVISGREGKFSAGFNLGLMTGGDLDVVRGLLHRGATVAVEIFMAKVPVVFAVTGHAIAMGGILTCAADYRVGASGAFKIGLNEVANGMPVPRFAIGLCRDRLDPAWFNRCVQMALMCTPDEAVDANFLDEVVDPDRAIDRAIEVATQLGAYVHPAPFAITRKAVRGDLAQRLIEELNADLATFDVAS